MVKVLVIDDEQAILDLLEMILKREQFQVAVANNGRTALALFDSFKPDIVILDLMLPDISGHDLCKEITKRRKTPIVMLTAKDDIVDKVLGLELGADDYITKPFSIREMLARVKAVLRRASIQQMNKVFKFGNICIDFEKHEVLNNHKKVDLTLKEFELLEILVKSKGRVVTREFLLEKVWGYEYVGETRTVDVHIRHLRQKIEEDDKNPQYIETVRGIGYRFNFGE